jgi:peptidyl-prolyl cis-trans isomerase D
MLRTALLALLAGAACGSTQGMAGPTLTGRVDDHGESAPEIQSNDILARDAVTSKAKVKHILIGWRDLADEHGGRQDPRAAARSREDADALALATLERLRAGEPIEPIMSELSEDSGSAKTGSSYTVTADAGLVFEFKRLGLRLNVGEAGMVRTLYGWHVMKRIE